MSEKPTTELGSLLSIIFVVNADHGPKVLFRYPHDVDNRSEDRSIPPGVFERKGSRTVEPPAPILDPKTLLNQLRDSSLESLLIPKSPEDCHKPFIVSIDCLRFLGYPFQPDTKCKNMYNIVFVVLRDTEHHIVESLINLSTRMSIALAYEERTNSYITKNLDVINRFYREADIPTKSHINPHKIEELDVSIIEHCPFSEMIAEIDSLAANLSEVYDSIKHNLYANVLIDRTINFSFFIQLNEIQDNIIRTTVAPFESFVILEDPNDIKKSLHHDSYPSLIKLLDLPRPYFRSLRDIAYGINLDYEEVCRAVLALVRWRKALIVYPIVSTNEYMVSHAVAISKYPEHDVKFREEFPSFKFYEELSKFSVRKSLSEILDCFKDKETIDTYKLIVVWFLRRKLLVQLFAHVYIKPAHDSVPEKSCPSLPSPPDIDLYDESPDARNCDDNNDVGCTPNKKCSYPSLTRGSHINEKEKKKNFLQYLSTHQIQRLKEVVDPDAAIMMTNFAKVLPHAHLGRTIEEILWRTNLQQQDLHDIIYRIFDEFLITIRHPTSIY